MAVVFFGLGSNLGDREQNLRLAITALEKEGIRVKRVSSFHETAPVGGPPQGPFLNAALEGETLQSPHELLKTVKAIEKRLGRTPAERNGPRTIDIDILFYDRIRLDEPNLVIPHPRVFERSFVLTPLREICPQILERWTDDDRPRHS